MRAVAKRNAAVGVGALLVAALILAGCLTNLKGLRFSHRDHAGEAACADCHQEGARAGHQNCRACHDIETDKPSEACLTCHTEGDYTVAAARPRSYADVRFDHGAHEGEACTLCHPGAERSASATDSNLPTMDQCASCHDGSEAPGDCATCHQVLRKDAAPASHSSVWPRQHGTAADRDERSCGYCHSERACFDCHTTQRPSTHTAAWKNSRHGIAADHDREPCAVCHRADECSRCHGLKPPSHYTAQFRVPTAPDQGHAALVAQRSGARSCLVCHERGFCAACHTNGF